MELTYTLTTIHTAVQEFWEYAKDMRIMAFSGEMGAGKTTFIHELCRFLKVKDAVSSPTFALINEYALPGDKPSIIYHMDWYRLNSTEEAIQAGMEDCLLQNAYCFIEWPEKAPELLHGPYLSVKIELLSEVERQMVITPL
ncbi:MAG: tRNA (adenosine(37)-N6)-threonylcarbamoyltransferase complex ATPase subunit type 1 TsaE [Taibaiella sp.]|nr:tRNA (adenosine(37)-N6)-threonylcarbamoyltransferase complex ATPase subunit type 1 TsaE [Taibaiella sp.]